MSTIHSKHDPKPKQLRVWQLVLIDLLVIGLGLNLFALVHIVFPQQAASAPQVISALPTAAVTAAEPLSTAAYPEEVPTEALPETTVEPTPEPIVYDGMFDEKFHDKFTDGEVIADESSYRSRNINVTYTEVSEPGLIYHVADIYVRDLKFLRTAFGRGAYAKGSEHLVDMSSRCQAVAAISGDHYNARLEGIVVRNGVLYRETRFDDVCLLLDDGSMVTMTNKELDLEAVKSMGVYQAWAFGPMLLDENGQVMSEFNSSVTRNNPRSAIGYVEPGHYVFIQVDGRIPGSNGITMQGLSQLFYDRGCVRAFNLDGGASSGFTWQGALVSYPYGRPVSDCIYVTDSEEAAE